jgi:L-amino acid N-acyltransferase YncA
MTTELRECRQDDYPALVSLLAGRRLPDAGLAEHLDTTILAHDQGRLVGSVAVEPYGDTGLLRSLAVAPDREARGLGTILLRAATDLARRRGLSRLYLLTETAAAFFARRGFRAITRDRIPADVLSSVEFTSACPDSALAMTRTLDEAAALDGSTGAVLVRPATGHDVDRMTDIYNEGIADRLATFETRMRQPSDVRAWFDGTHPQVVAVRDEEVTAFASTSTYRPRDCYAGIAEYSVYVRRGARGEGLGRAAMRGLLQVASEAGYWKLLSRIFVENEASRRLMRSLGFREVGIYERHGRLDGVWRNVVIVEHLL